MRLFYKVILFFLTTTFIYAHPHMFADLGYVIHTKDSKVKQIDIKWIFDDMSSQMLIMDYDINKNSKFEKKESLTFKKNVFDTLSEYGYYTHVKVGNSDIKPLDKYIKNFFITIEKNRFVTNFSLDLSTIKQNGKVAFGCWDEEFYTSMEIKKKNIHFKGVSMPFKIKDLEEDIYLGYLVELNK